MIQTPSYVCELVSSVTPPLIDGTRNFIELLSPILPWLELSMIDIKGSCDDASMRHIMFGDCAEKDTGISPPPSHCLSLTIRNNHALKAFFEHDIHITGGTELSFPCLTELHLNNVPNIVSLDIIGAKVKRAQNKTVSILEPDLQTLFIRSNKVMTELPLLMPSTLLSVSLKETVVSSLDNLLRCRLLKELDISGSKNIGDLPATLNFSENFPYLNRLNASQTKIITIDALNGCESLEVLLLDGTAQLRRLTKIPFLKELSLNYSDVSDLSLIEDHPTLTSLEIAWNKDIVAVPCLPAIKFLRLEGCSLLTEIAMLHGSPTLEVLKIEQCRNLVSLPALPRLKILSATCSGLTSDAIDQAFTDHARIEEIFLRGCPHVRREMPRMPNIRKIIVDDDNCV